MTKSELQPRGISLLVVATNQLMGKINYKSCNENDATGESNATRGMRAS